MTHKVYWLFITVWGGLVLLNASATPLVEEADSESVVTASIENLDERPTSLYCACNNIDGRELVFDLTVTNRSDAPRQVYAFVWASNDQVSPPERGLWPLSAIDASLTDTGELEVTDPSAGTLIELQSGASVRLKENTIRQPIGWFEGELVSFQALWLQLWSAEGELVFEALVDLGE
jgi:hypothetical protein